MTLDKVLCCMLLFCFLVLTLHGSMIGAQVFKLVEGNSSNPCIHNFSFLLAGHREPQSNNAKLLVAYAFTLQAPVVRKVDNAIHRINHYPVDSVVCFVNTYPLDCDLSGG